MTGCAAPTTRLAPIPESEVKAEEQRQRELALQEQETQQARFDSIAYPLLARSTALCPDAVGPILGLRVATVHMFEAEWKAAATSALGLGDTLTVTGVTPESPAALADLRRGDRILQIGDRSVPTGQSAGKASGEALSDLETSGAREVSVRFVRDGQPQTATLSLTPACRYGTVLVNTGDLNAFADGERIYLTSTMMRFAEDDELRVVIAHEFAHNAMGHIKAKQKNSLFGAILGALADVYLASRGVNTGGYYTSAYARLGAMTFSQDFEREADYVGLYALAHSGVSLDAAPRFWRHIALADPESIELAYSHPTTAERFVRMEHAIREIEGKRAAGIALVPEMKRDQRRPREAQQPVYAMGQPSASQPDTAGVQGYAPSPTTRAAEQAAAPPTLVEQRSPQEALVTPEGPLVPAAGKTASDSVTLAASELATAPRSPDELGRYPALGAAINDIVRLGVANRVGEASPGLLVVTLSPDGLAVTSARYNLQQLYLAYSAATTHRAEVAIELRQDDKLVGWFTRDGLTLARQE